MNTITRGFRNAFRNTIRTFSIVLILGISVGLALSMLIARQAVQDKIDTIKSSIGNTISISPAGARGFEGGGEALTTEQMTALGEITDVTSVRQQLNDRLTSDDTSLQSAIDAGSLGNRAQMRSGVGFTQPPTDMPQMEQRANDSSAQGTRTFTPPVTVTGTNDVETPAVYGGDSVTFTSGQAFDPTSSEAVAVIGKAIAQKNSLTVGATFTAYGTDIKVVGIYDTGNTFSNNGVIMPIAALQKLSERTSEVTSAVVTVNSVDTIDTTLANVKSELGTKADVVSDQESAKTAVEPLESVKSISTFSVFGALGAGAIIILLTMMMIVRERRREIGVMKAIGSSNFKTVVQFMSEAVTLTFLGLIVGVLVSLIAAQPVTNTLVNNSASTTNSSNSQAGGPMGGGGMRQGRGGFAGQFGGAANSALRSAETIKTSIGLDVLLYGVGIAFLIAILGSAFPAYFISKIRPAEVMRAD